MRRPAALGRAAGVGIAYTLRTPAATSGAGVAQAHCADTGPPSAFLGTESRLVPVTTVGKRAQAWVVIREYDPVGLVGSDGQGEVPGGLRRFSAFFVGASAICARTGDAAG